MPLAKNSKLSPKKKYLQIALNSTLDEAYKIIKDLPISDRIIVEAGTPFIKRYGQAGIRNIHDWYAQRLNFNVINPYYNSNIPANSFLQKIFTSSISTQTQLNPTEYLKPYIVADLKTMDRAHTEVEIAANGGASAAIALGSAPVETLNSFIEACDAFGLDAMIDMMNVEFPLSVLRSLKKVPPVVIIHRGVDEEKYNKQKQIPLHEIRRIKGNYNIMISIAGGDTLREVQSAVFNDADIVVIWKSVYNKSENTDAIINGFLKEIK